MVITHGIGRAAAVAVAVALAGCTYKPGLGDNPITRSASWYSYLKAEDWRPQCRKGAPDRYRIVYNGTADTQVRTYDITTGGPGGGADMTATYKGELDVSGPIAFDNLLGPWRARREHKSLSAAELARIREALHASGLDNPPQGGTRLHSWSYFWIVAACENGRFKYNGWAYGTDRFAQVNLAPALAAADPIDKPFTTPKETEPPERDERGNREGYELFVTADGPQGHLTLF